MERVLEVKDLHVTFTTYGGTIQAVRGVSFSLNKGETFAIVGESGCGKSVTSQSIMGLLPSYSAKITKGSILFKGTDLTQVSEKEIRTIRGAEISMIFQDPMTALNPTLTVGEQLMEAVLQHKKITRKEAKKAVLSMLDLVGIPNPDERFKQYPHEFSGGMRQRIVIAMALMCEPEVIIADEPTTALDVTIQAQILELFNKIQKETGVAIILITHDLGIVAQVADRIAVMYAGKMVETGTRREIFYHPQHPYTKGLLHSVPRLDLKGAELIPVPGTPPDLFSPPSGCPFTARCPYAMEVCEKVYPVETYLSDHHHVYCWLQDKRAKAVQLSSINGQ
ncbi:ABC transporter ATP-binding protein [Bacillus gobiensis]|uniref:ABC transporter ATP-binding protein n=1 Tax=Bacillus gobiensis TaxID=1441095 RepID=UPI003D20CFA0